MPARYVAGFLWNLVIVLMLWGASSARADSLNLDEVQSYSLVSKSAAEVALPVESKPIFSELAPEHDESNSNRPNSDLNKKDLIQMKNGAVNLSDDAQVIVNPIGSTLGASLKFQY